MYGYQGFTEGKTHFENEIIKTGVEEFTNIYESYFTVFFAPLQCGVHPHRCGADKHFLLV